MITTKKKKALKIPEILEEHERELLLKQANKRYVTGERNQVMMRLMLNVGTRLAETIDLKWSDINMMSGKLFVREGKGKKDRVLWLSDSTIEKLRDWKERQASEIGETRFVFTTSKGEQLQHRYVQQMIQRYAKKAGISKHITPHTLRHTFATDLFRDTKNIRIVQKALGHSDLSTTMIYTHIIDDELENAMKNLRK